MKENKAAITVLIHSHFNSIQTIAASIEHDPNIILAKEYIVFGKEVELLIVDIFVKLNEKQQHEFKRLFDEFYRSIPSNISLEQAKIFSVYYKMQALHSFTN